MYCDDNEIWMDESRGLLCRGPDGPECANRCFDLGVKEISSDIRLLKEDALIGYLAQLVSNEEIDKEIVRGICLATVGQESEVGVDRPTVLFASPTSNDTVALGKG